MPTVRRGRPGAIAWARSSIRMLGVLGSVDVGADALERVVFGGGDMLQRGRMHDDVDLAHRHVEPIAVTHVADEEAQASASHRSICLPAARFRLGKLLLHLVLL